MPKKQVWFALGYLFITALLGTLMRGAPFLGAFGLELPNVLHGHSHIAFQGWMFSFFFIAFCALFLDEETYKRGKYKLQFILFQVIFPCILLSFVYGGYFYISITFSSAFQFVAYWFLARAGFDLLKKPSSPARSLALWALFSFFLSTLGPWALAVISAKGMADTYWYSRSVYFFLHFQYNGAFILGLVAFWLRSLENRGLKLKGWTIRWGVILLIASVFPAYFLSLLGEENVAGWLRGLSVLGILTQLAGVTLLGIAVIGVRKKVIELHPGFVLKFLIGFTFIILFAKSLLQTGSCVPEWQQIFFSNRNLVIGYLHMVLIGMLSLGFIGIALLNGWLNRESIGLKWGFFLFFQGFWISEIMLFLFGLGTSVPSGAMLLFLASALMMIGMVGVLISGLNQKTGVPKGTP